MKRLTVYNKFDLKLNKDEYSLLRKYKEFKLHGNLVRKAKIMQTKINLLFGQLKSIYGGLLGLIDPANPILYNLRNVIYMIGTTIYSKKNMLNVRDLIYKLINTDISTMTKLEQIIIKDYTDYAVKMVRLYEKLLLVDFKIRNIEIFLNKII